MKLVFFGTAEFAVASLDACVQSHDVACVVTQPDKRGNRGSPAPRPVRERAEQLGIAVDAPPRIRDDDAMARVASLAPDCIVVAAYGQILPAPLLDTPRFGAVNVHASLLPRWRGAAPVARAILAGDAKTGVSIMRMDPGLDTGPVYASRAVTIEPGATTPSLTSTLAQLGAAMLVDVLAALERGVAVATPQPGDGVMLAPRLGRAEGALEWSTSTAADIDRHVRALQPWPGTTLPLVGQRVRILEGAVSDASAKGAAPGMVVRREGDSLTVAASDGCYRVDRVLPPGSRAMSAAAYARGRREDTR